jgi:hypothetical protein
MLLVYSEGTVKERRNAIRGGISGVGAVGTEKAAFMTSF